MLSCKTTSNTSRRLKNGEPKLKRRSSQLKPSMTLLKPCTMSKRQPKNKENSTRESSRLLKNSMIDRMKPPDFLENLNNLLRMPRQHSKTTLTLSRDSKIKWMLIQMIKLINNGNKISKKLREKPKT